MKNIDIVILCGGRSTRLRQLTRVIPKPMVRFNRQPFLDILIDYISLYGFKRFILCTGYKKEIIKNYYKRKKKDALNIVFSPEEKPLGTGGAIKNAAQFIQSNPFIVVNGDSLCKVNLQKFIKFHIEKKALVSIVLTYFQKDEEYGYVVLNHLKQITNFCEKSSKNSGNYVNAGIYSFDRRVFHFMPHQDSFSLEYDVFPKIKKNKFYGYITKSDFIDIGTPQRYKIAKQIIGGQI